MADGITIKVDATQAYAKLDRITPEVRDELRTVIPDLTRALGSLVNSKLSSELKSRRTLTVTQQMRESANQIIGVVGLESPSANGLLPTYLEKGTRPHEIKGNPVLAFVWDKGPNPGSVNFFRYVNHPGTKAYAFMERSLGEMQSDIVSEISNAVTRAAGSAR